MPTKLNIPIIDLHTDFILGEKNLGTRFFNINTSGQISKKKTEAANAKILLAGFSYDDEAGCTEKMLSEMEKFEKRNSKFGLIFHLEGAGILAKDKTLLGKFFKRGVRSIGLAHVHDNALVGSSSGEKQYGLTRMGKGVIKKAIKLGMLIDLAHMSQKGFSETLDLIGKRPPLVSHTACNAIQKNPRNIKDSQIRTVAKKNGVVGIFFSGKYINEMRKPSVKDVANHIDHLAKLVGIDHVAIGSDFGGITKGTPKGLESIDKMKNLFLELVKRGYTQEEIEKVAFQNAQRILVAWKILKEGDYRAFRIRT